MTINELLEKLIAAKESVEAKFGVEISGKVIGTVLEHSVRKCIDNGKDGEYLPLLFENELRDYYTRTAINVRSESNV